MPTTYAPDLPTLVVTIAIMTALYLYKTGRRQTWPYAILICLEGAGVIGMLLMPTTLTKVITAAIASIVITLTIAFIVEYLSPPRK